MSTASESLKTYTERYFLNGCGSCSYVYNSDDGCYQREAMNCTSGCTCPPLICGLTSALMQHMHPESVTRAASVLWSCSSSDGEQANAQLLFGVLTSLVSSVTFWRRVAIGLGIVSALLIVGLIFALLR
jgi:hypothetical protein